MCISQLISGWNARILQFQSIFVMLLIPLKWRHSILNGGLLNTSSFKCGMKLLIRFRTSTVASLKFRNSAMMQLFKYWNGYVISSHASLNVWLLIHAGMAKTDTAEMKVRPKTDRAEMKSTSTGYPCVLTVWSPWKHNHQPKTFLWKLIWTKCEIFLNSACCGRTGDILRGRAQQPYTFSPQINQR